MVDFIMKKIASPAESGVAMTIERVFENPAGQALLISSSIYPGELRKPSGFLARVPRIIVPFL